MSMPHNDYVEKMRAKGATDAEIKKALAAGGWLKEEIDQLFAEDGIPVPAPPHRQTAPATPGNSQNQQPIAVVQRYSTVGLEYIIMFVSLGIGAVSLGALLHAWVNSATRIEAGWFAIGADISGIAAIVTLPIFLILFMRLRRVEQADPAVHNDPSRRRGVQLALIVAFVWGIKSIVTYLYNLLHGNADSLYSYYSRYDNNPTDPGTYQVAQVLHLVITLGIAGTIFAYYWWDEHRTKDRSRLG